MSAIHVTKENFHREVLQSEKPVLLDFFAPWCGPCRMLAPVLDEIAQERSDIKVVKVDVDQEQELAVKFGVVSIPSLFVVKDGKVVGAILCGHDGRRGCLYHVCVDPEYRKQGIGTAMVVFAMNALKRENISKVSLIAFTQNDIGNAFWRKIGWTQRLDLNYYDFTLNTENIVAFNE